MVPGAGIEPARLAAGDFESPASTNFTTRARGRDKDYDIELSCGLGCVSGGFESVTRRNFAAGSVFACFISVLLK